MGSHSIVSPGLHVLVVQSENAQPKNFREELRMQNKAYVIGQGESFRADAVSSAFPFFISTRVETASGPTPSWLS
jgi:hypothetical protein